MFSISGTLKVKKDTQVISDRFSKREFVVNDTSGQYPQDILFQLTQDKTALLDNLNEGDMVTVSFFIRGREWTSPQGEIRYFNSLDAWKVESQGAPAAAPAPAAASAATDSGSFDAGDSEDDLPF